MQTAEIDTRHSKLDFETLSFSTDLKSEIDSRSTRRAKNKITRFIYSVGNYNFLLEQDIKVENLSNLAINIIPHVPEWCIGIVNVRGNIMPIVDMHVFLKTNKKNKQTNAKIIMVEHKNHAPIIFQVDRLPEMIFLDDYTHSKAPESSPSWLISSLKNKAKTIYEINHAELMAQLKYT